MPEPKPPCATGSVIRTGMHYLNRIVNQLNGAIEISAPMAAVAIQDTSAEFDDFDANNSLMDGLEKETQSDEDIIIDKDDNTFNNKEPVTGQVPSYEEEIPIDHTLEPEDHEDIVVINDTSETEQTLGEFFCETEPMILSPEQQHRLTTQLDEGVISTETI
ncbi:hypothetical protein GHT06_008899 [Daphnia sinensis]|uniref:Uncharacterized protein n=1 Tax=Daphnia sinensis TaxID=1820382 RepID=A0AAD5LW29_9CRUS|nr:hypothetical protein GHT06_008899 [Daphnia sinensis]